MNHIKFNLIPSGYKETDYRVLPKLTSSNIKSNIKSNKVVDLSQYCSPVKAQGNVGSCTGFATIACMEYLMKKNNVNLKLLSERFTYYVTRVNVLKQDTTDTGASIRDALKSVIKFGSCLSSTFPYTGDYQMKPSLAIYKEASKYNAVAYARFDDITNVNMNMLNTTINTLKASLDAGVPIIGGFTCYNSIYNSVNGVIPLQEGKPIGGHAIFIVGYNDNTKLFKFKNSWGLSWGDKGYGYLPYDYYLKGDLFDLWSIYNQNIDTLNIGLIVINPSINNIIIQNYIQDIFSSINDVLLNSMDKKQIDILVQPIIDKYKSNPKLFVFIKNMITSLKSVL